MRAAALLAAGVATAPFSAPFSAPASESPRPFVVEFAGGVALPDTPNAWGARARGLYERLGLTEESRTLAWSLSGGGRLRLADAFEVGGAYHTLRSEIELSSDTLGHHHATVVHGVTFDLRVRSASEYTSLFAGLGVGPRYAAVEARGHLGHDRATNWGVLGEIQVGTGVHLGPFELSLRTGYTYVALPGLKRTYYARGGDAGGFTLSAGASWTFGSADPPVRTESR
jgi:hypothetical protein